MIKSISFSHQALRIIIMIKIKPRVILPQLFLSLAKLIFIYSYYIRFYAIFNKKVKYTDNWANSWKIQDSNQPIYIFFWPQILEWVGFGLMIGLAGYLVIKRK